MGKRFKLSLIFMGVLLATIIPNTVFAAEYGFDKRNVEKNDGETKIPVYISADGSEIINQGKITCDVPSTEVICEVEPVEGEFAGELDSTNNNYVYAPMNPNEALSSGNHTIAYVILKNSSTSKQSVTVSLKGSTINGTSKEASIDTVVSVPKSDEPKSNDATLKSVTISQGKLSPEFSKDVTDYTIYGIADTINSVRITPKVNHDRANFDISGGKSVNGTSVTLNQGENKVVVSVIAEDGSSLNYNFTIYRGETNFNSARLESLSIGNYTLTPAFSSSVTEYTLTVPNTVTTVQDLLQYKTLDEKANVLVKGTDNFVIGTNTLTVTVDNVSGDETVTYKIIVNRLSEENIEILKYINQEVTFKDADGIQTTLKLDEFQRTYPGEYNKIINNEYKFDAQGNIVLEAPSTDDKREEPEKEDKKDSKVWLIVVLVIVGLLIIGIAGVLIFRKKDKDEPTEEKKENEETPEATEKEKKTNIGEDFSDDENKTVDIDEALSDLMNTKQYEFQDEEEKDN